MWWRYCASWGNKIYESYITLESLLKKRDDLKKIFISDEWDSHKLSRMTIGCEVEGLMFNHAYWEKVSNLVSIYEALYTVLLIVDSEVVPTIPFVYELIRVMKQNLHELKAKDWVKKSSQIVGIKPSIIIFMQQVTKQ